VTPRGATGLLAPLSGMPRQNERSQDEIASLLHNENSLAAYAADQADRPRIKPTEPILRDRAPLPPDAPLAKPVDLTSVFRMVPAAEANHQGMENEDKSAPGSMFSTPLSPYGQSSGEVEEAEGFTKIFRSLSAPTVAPDSAKTRENESSLPVEMSRGSANSIAATGLPTRDARFTEFAAYREGGGSWGEPSDSREQTSASGVSQMGGGFTQLLRTLSKDMDEPSSEQGMPEPAVRSARDLDGPGEFTRIISNSMLREAQGRTSTPVAVSRSPSEMSGEVPAFQRETLPETQVPQVADVLVSQAMASPQNLPSKYVLPQPAALPSGAPHTPVAAGPPPFLGRLQSYVPLLLIVNVFLMLLVLLALGVVIMRH